MSKATEQKRKKALRTKKNEEGKKKAAAFVFTDDTPVTPQTEAQRLALAVAVEKTLDGPRHVTRRSRTAPVSAKAMAMQVPTGRLRWRAHPFFPRPLNLILQNVIARRYGSRRGKQNWEEGLRTVGKDEYGNMILEMKTFDSLPFTPEELAFLSNYNSKNRDLSPTLVGIWRTCYRNGTWVQCSQGISFRQNGQVQNGGHRLNGGVGVTTEEVPGGVIVMNVTINEPKSAYKAIDKLRARGPAQQAKELDKMALNILQHWPGNFFSAAKSLVVTQTKQTVPAETILEAAYTHFEILDEIYDIMKTGRPGRARSGSVIAVFARAAYVLVNKKSTRTRWREVLKHICSSREAAQEDVSWRIYKMIHSVLEDGYGTGKAEERERQRAVLEWLVYKALNEDATAYQHVPRKKGSTDLAEVFPIPGEENFKAYVNPPGDGPQGYRVERFVCVNKSKP